MNSWKNFNSSAKRRLFIKWFVLSLSLVPFSLSAWTFEGKVVGVSDGDTIKVLDQKVLRKVRLAYIDCPEKRQAFGKRAKQFTSDQVFGKWVKVEVVDTDRYKRQIGIVKRGRKNLNRKLLKAGLAWHYKKYSKDRKLAKLETKARKKKRGLWQEPHPVPPWEFRRK